MLAAGDAPLWTPVIFAGFDLHGEGQLGAFHPLHQLLYRALPLDVAVNLEILLTYIWALAGMRWLLRRLDLSPAAALAGAMTWALGGFMLTHYPHLNMLTVLAHLPWVLGCFDVLVVATGPERQPSRAIAFAGAALLIGSQALFGFPQALWWTLLTGSAFVLWRARVSDALQWPRLVAPAAAAIIGLLIGGLQILPTLAASAHSTRAHESHSFLLGYSLHPWNIVQLWSPYALYFRAFSRLDQMQFHEFALYPSALLVLSPIWLWIRRASLGRRRSLAAACGGFALVMLVLALGRYGWLASLLLYIPGVSSFRAPARYIVLMQLALATLAALTIEDLVELRSRGVNLSRAQIAAILSVAALNVLTLLLLNTGLIPVAPDVLVSNVVHAGTGTAIIVGATALLLLAARGIPWAVPVLIVFTAIDLSCWGLSYIYRTPPVPLSAFAMRMPDNPGPAPMRLTGPSNWSDVPLMNGYQLVGGYAGLYPQTVLSWDEDPFIRLAGATRRFDKELNVFEITGSVPRARMLTDVRVSHEVASDIQQIDLLHSALVNESIAPLDGSVGEARIVTDRPGHFIVNTDARGRQLLSLSERFDDGWKATIDGAPASPIRVNGDFLGVVVDRGAHLVELRYEPQAFARGEMVTLAGSLALVAGLVVMLRR
jgi:hypothetical protein